MEGLTFEHVSEVNAARCSRWHPGFPTDDQWSIADWSNAMAGEAGEACNVVKKMRRHELHLANAGDPPIEALRAMLAKELADTFTYLDLLATKCSIDLGAAICAKFNEVSERQGFPERLP